MNERQRNMIVGLTTLAGLAGLIGLLMIFGYLPAILNRGYLVQIDLPRAAGLHEGSRVRYAGIDVGIVEDVELRMKPRPGVLVTARIRPEIELPENVQVAVTAPFFGGGASIDLSAPELLPGQTVAQLPTDGSALLQGDVPDLASTMVAELRSAMQEPVANLDRLTDEFEVLSEAWTKVGHNINELIETRDPDAVARGETTGNLATVLARTDQRLMELEEVLAGVNAYVNDADLREDVQQAAANTRALTDKVAGSVESLEKRYVAVADSLGGAIDSMKKTLDQAREPTGTLGRMLADPALYDNLNDAAQRMQKAIDDLRLLVQKWKAEGLPVDIF